MTFIVVVVPIAVAEVTVIINTAFLLCTLEDGVRSGGGCGGGLEKAVRAVLFGIQKC